MKNNLKRNLFKGVIGIACFLLPLHKTAAQNVIKAEVENDSVFGLGATYTVLEQSDVYGYGTNVSAGVMSSVKPFDTNLVGCAALLFDGGVSTFNNQDVRYSVGFVFKLGFGYSPIVVSFVKDVNFVLDKAGRGLLLEAHGVGTDISVGKYTKIFADMVFANQLTYKNADVVKQKYIARMGLIYTFSRKGVYQK